VNPSYSVQVGAFKTGDASDSLVKKLQGKGYQAFAQSGVTRDKSPIIRVLVGRFEDRKAAVKLAREIEAKEQIRTTIFSD
jgi:cell division septation protein DedD